MIAIQVPGDDGAVAFAGSQGNFELNAMRPLIINAFLHSATILADGCEKFRTYSVTGTELDAAKIAGFVGNSLMLVTALSPAIGYQNAAHIAEQAAADGTTLRAAALASGHVDAATFDRVVNVRAMVGTGVAGAWDCRCPARPAGTATSSSFRQLGCCLKIALYLKVISMSFSL